MCGIAGYSLSPDERVDSRVLATALLSRIEERGRHATGAAFFDGGRAWVQKDPIPASTFIKDLDMSAEAPTAVLHTRWATKGSPKDNANNHPIEIPGRMLGVHNGCLWNDDALFEVIGRSKRIAEVDSEAIFAALSYLDEKAPAALSRLEGSAAVAWIEPEGDENTLHVARVEASPLIYGMTEAGSFVFASTEHALTGAVREAGMHLSGGPYALAEGTYLRVRHGAVVTKATFGESRTVRRPLSVMEKKALNIA